MCRLINCLRKSHPDTLEALPFTAHAWAECQGRIVGDDRARCEQFVPVAIYE